MTAATAVAVTAKQPQTATTAVRLSDHTRSVLATAAIDGQRVRLTCGQLTPDLFAPVHDTMEAIGGVWAARRDAYAFPAHINPLDAITAVLDTGRVPMHPRNAEGYVRTPDTLADELTCNDMRDIGSLHESAIVLEPSAGDGAIVRALLINNEDIHVHAVEPDPARAHALRVLADDHPGRVTVYEMRFEDFARAWTGEQFDAVAMNPPFAVPGAPTLWIDHVRAAHALLRPGGHLLSVVPRSYGNPSKVYVQMRAYVEAHGGRFENLPDDAFKTSGTGFRTGVLHLPKPLPPRTDGRPRWVLDTLATGEPVRVPYARPTHAHTAPVQAYRGYGGDQVARLVGECFGCSRPLFAHDAGDEPSLNWAACSALNPREYGKTGPHIGVCMTCCDHSSVYDAAYAAAAPYWTTTGAQPGTDARKAPARATPSAGGTVQDPWGELVVALPGL